jgi:hypothetical protein
MVAEHMGAISLPGIGVACKLRAGTHSLRADRMLVIWIKADINWSGRNLNESDRPDGEGMGKFAQRPPSATANSLWLGRRPCRSSCYDFDRNEWLRWWWRIHSE